MCQARNTSNDRKRLATKLSRKRVEMELYLALPSLSWDVGSQSMPSTFETLAAPGQTALRDD